MENSKRNIKVTITPVDVNIVVDVLLRIEATDRPTIFPLIHGMTEDELERLFQEDIEDTNPSKRPWRNLFGGNALNFVAALPEDCQEILLSSVATICKLDIPEHPVLHACIRFLKDMRFDISGYVARVRTNFSTCDADEFAVALRTYKDYVHRHWAILTPAVKEGLIRMFRSKQ